MFFREAIENYKEAQKQNPGSRLPISNMGSVYDFMRDFDSAETTWKRLVSVWPEFVAGHKDLAWFYIKRDGSVTKARQIIEETVKKYGSKGITNHVHDILMLDGKFEDALNYVTPASYGLPHFYFQLAWDNFFYLNRISTARAYADSAKPLLEARVASEPDIRHWHYDLGIICAILGEKERAVKEGKIVAKFIPVNKDAMFAPNSLQRIAVIYVLVGEYDAAIDKLEYLFSIPYDLTVPLLKTDPVWAPLRGHPRFQKLIAREEK
ncbi:MAG: tetratricopeptide repeat protein [bacterium]